MRGLDITTYQYKFQDEDGKEQSRPYNMKEACAEILLHRSLNLNGTALLKRNILAQKILEVAPEMGGVLLEEAEYEMLKSSVDRIQGFAREDVECVRRILEAPEVTVKEVDNG